MKYLVWDSANKEVFGVGAKKKFEKKGSHIPLSLGHVNRKKKALVRLI